MVIGKSQSLGDRDTHDAHLCRSLQRVTPNGETPEHMRKPNEQVKENALSSSRAKRT
jgi:hypothetical protein